MGAPDVRRELGLKLIIVYKLVKAPLMIALAIWLTTSPRTSGEFAYWVARDLHEGGWLAHRLGHWLESVLSPGFFSGVKALAWIDGLFTAVEGGLLLVGKSWGEWLVIGGLSALIPAELVSIAHRLSWGKAVVLLVNLGIVAYLVRRRLGEPKKHEASQP